MRWITILIVPPICLLLTGFFIYAHGIQKLESTSFDQEVDLIIVLTGGTGRIAEGLRLLEEEKAPRLFVTGVEASEWFHLVVPDHNVNDLKREGKLFIDPSAKNTKENAVQAKKLLSQIQPKPKRLLLVSSTYHLPRAELAFRRVLPEGYEISLFSVKSHNFNPKRWYLNWGSSKLLVGEYLKYLWYQVVL